MIVDVPETLSIVLSILVFFSLTAPRVVASEPRHTWISKDDVLTWRDGRFYLGGKPYAEISFNKFDLFWQLWDEVRAGNELNESNPKYAAQESALREFRDLGLQTIRIFALPWARVGFDEVFEDAESRELIFHKAMDAVLDLCDKYGIKVIYCLGCGDFADRYLIDGKWVLGDEHKRELVADPHSKSRARLYTYLDDVIGRYRDRKTIAMWEITNELTLDADILPENRTYEGQRMPTLKDVAGFFDDVTKKIKSIDGLRMVNSGGSNLRESAWNLYNNKGWTTDSLQEHQKAFDLLYANNAIDVIDIHYYQVWNNGYLLKSEKGGKVVLNIKGYMDIAKKIGKPLIVGEYAALPALKSETNVWKAATDYFESYDDSSALKWVKKALDDVVEADAPLVYWWSYQSDREQDAGVKNRYDIDINRNPELLKLFVDANRRLKERL